MNGWKITAIIFISLFVLQTMIFIGLLSMGLSIIYKENQCGMECSNFNDESSYLYDMDSNICECYINNEVVKSMYIIQD